MSNILIIKHGSLGDLIQANGAIHDIKNSHQNSKVLLLTSPQYANLMSQCPYIDGVIIDKRKPRWNLYYLIKLKNLLDKYQFTKVFDLQNSSRTNFYKRFLLNKKYWSSTETALENGQTKKDFDQEPVLERMQVQLRKSGIQTNNITKVDLSWSIQNISRTLKQYTSGEYILIFPFCSKKHVKKKWPFYKDLVLKLKSFYKNKYSILIAPGPGEIEEAKKFNAKIVLEDSKPVNLNFLISLINGSKFIISNDTGPAHISSHLNVKGLALFGSHTSPKKVSMENINFKTLSVKNLNELSVNDVFKKVQELLN